MILIFVIVIGFSIGFYQQTAQMKKQDMVIGKYLIQLNLQESIENYEINKLKTGYSLRGLKRLQELKNNYKKQPVVAYLFIDHTRMDYPVMYSGDNKFYLNHDPSGQSNIAGAIFMDYENDPTIINRHTILYGHNMRNKTMFGDLVRYKNKDFFYENPYILFVTERESCLYEIFSAHSWSDASNNFYIRTKFDSDDDFLEFIESLQNFSHFEKRLNLTASDEILTLSTCSYETKNARFVVHAKRLRSN